VRVMGCVWVEFRLGVATRMCVGVFAMPDSIAGELGAHAYRYVYVASLAGTDRGCGVAHRFWIGGGYRVVSRTAASSSYHTVVPAIWLVKGGTVV